MAINSSLGGMKFGTDGDGNYGYYVADGSLIPFKSIRYLGQFTGNSINLSAYGNIQNVLPIIRAITWYEGTNCILQNMKQTQNFSFDTNTKILTLSFSRSYGNWSPTAVVDVYAF